MGPGTVWFVEEHTPETAQWLHVLERSLPPGVRSERLRYPEALKRLGALGKSPSEPVAILTFSRGAARALGTLVGPKGTARARLAFWPTELAALADWTYQARFAAPLYAAARHLGEAAFLHSAGFEPSRVACFHLRLDPARLPARAGEPRPLAVGFAWPNLSAAARASLEAEISRWRAAAPDAVAFSVFCLPGDLPPAGTLEGVRRIVLGPEHHRAPEPLDVALVDPFWPTLAPEPYEAAVRVYLPPGGLAHDAWRAKLQALIDLASAGHWEAARLWKLALAPFWALMAGETAPETHMPWGAVSVAELEAAKHHWQKQIAPLAETFALLPEGPGPEALDYFFRLYDYRVHVSWLADLWRDLTGLRGLERHARLAALCALPLATRSSGWLFKRLLNRTRARLDKAAAQGFSLALDWRFWLRFAWKHRPLVAEMLRSPDAPISPTLRAIAGDDPELALARALAEAVLVEAGLTLEIDGEPELAAGKPTLYLLSHRHGVLDPFILLSVLPGRLAVVVGPKAQRARMFKRLSRSRAFLLSGQERGVILADAIAAVRDRRALALYPEVATPSYLGESSTFRQGLLWILEALPGCAIVPVALVDPHGLRADARRVGVRFGPTIEVEQPEDAALALDRVRFFFVSQTPAMRQLDTPGAEGTL